MQWEQGQDSIPVWLRDRVLRTHTYTCVQTQYIVMPASKHSCAYLPGCLRDGGAFLFRVVCVQASHSCIRRLCMSLSVFVLPAPPTPHLQSPGEIALRPLAQRLGVDCSRPGLSHPNPASHTLSQACDLTFRGRSWPSVLISCLSGQLSGVSSPCETLV